jgi:hypothetical protein
MQKKLTILCLMMIVIPFLFPTLALAERCISVLPDTTVVGLGMQFSLEVVVNDTVKSLMGYDVTVQYDRSILEVVSVREGALLRDSGHTTFFYWLNPACGCDFIIVNGSILGDVVDGPGALFKITFKSIKFGTIPVSIHESDIRNDQNQSLTHRTQNGVVIIEPPIGTENSSWSRAKNLYR